MRSSRSQGALALPIIIVSIMAGCVVLSFLFYFSWKQLNDQVEVTLREQFNQQQLMLARKIADNVESYFDFLENALLGYAGLFQTAPLAENGLEASLMERFARHQRFGILEIRRYGPDGVGVQVFSTSATASKPGNLHLPAPYLQWAQNPDHRGKLFLSKTYVASTPPWQGKRVMRFLTPLYWSDAGSRFAGVVEFVINPFFICDKVTADVRSGQTGYAWIIDQDEIMLAHFEKDFVGHNALQVRIARNPNIVFRGLRELQAELLAGKEGITEYDSGWHRQKLGQMPKLAAYTPINFQKGLIRGVTEVEDPAHNLWGVCVVAPVAEVSGNISKVLHQELFLVGLFLMVMLTGAGGLIGTALFWNKSLARQVELKTNELLESQERLVHSERFAAVGEAAAYVSHEIKNPLMVIGGLAHQVERRLPADQAAQEKLRIIQKEVKRLENFLGELRDFLRPVQPHKEEIDLNQQIRDIVSLMEEAAQDKSVILEDLLDPLLPRIEADPNQLEQVLVNLIKNSLEACDSPGRIVLRTGSRDAQVWFSVQDTGKGMAPEVLDKIFHPFFTTKEKGTGLGLAVIHKIITDHNGTVTVDSASGQGSTFTIRLPQKGTDAA
jgi:two-component system, NtrC family, sensor histidine kinase HydH